MPAQSCMLERWTDTILSTCMMIVISDAGCIDVLFLVWNSYDSVPTRKFNTKDLQVIARLNTMAPNYLTKYIRVKSLPKLSKSLEKH